VVRRCPSAGHLLVAVFIRFALGGAVELENGIDADFPDWLRDASPLVSDSDFALVFVAADFSLIATCARRAAETRRVQSPTY
jgi:hypothetical protein